MNPVLKSLIFSESLNGLKLVVFVIVVELVVVMRRVVNAKRRKYRIIKLFKSGCQGEIKVIIERVYAARGRKSRAKFRHANFTISTRIN